MKIQIFALFVCMAFFACKEKKSVESNNSKSIEYVNNRPNVIVILIDDAGYVDFGFMGSKDLDTPNIDALAKDGIILTDAHVSATVCAPSRAGIMTGKYQQRFGFEANDTGDAESGDIGLSDDVVTMADVFKENNYNTIAIGKWHLGASPSDHPNQRGFNEFYGFLGGGRSYFPTQKVNEKTQMQRNGNAVELTEYLTDALGKESVRFVEENKSKPFFMYLAFNAVHTPMEAKAEHLEKYKNHTRKELAAMTWSLDENIGKLRNKLKELNLLENTLIYFLSDNGGAHNNQSSNGILKGWKGNKFEGGQRVPFVISWPKMLKGNQKYDGLASSLDIFKTSMCAANISSDENLSLDGVDLIPYLKNQIMGNPHDILYWRKLDESAVRMGNYKLIALKNFDYALYNLNNDLSEATDVSRVEAAKSQELLQKLTQWESEIATPLWREGSEWEDVTYHIHEQLMRNKPALYKAPNEKKQITSKNK